MNAPCPFCGDDHAPQRHRLDRLAVVVYVAAVVAALALTLLTGSPT